MESIIKMTGGVIRQQQNTILKNVNIDIKSGEFIYLIGKVGSGKSSFLKTLYAELPLEYGTAEVAGFQLKKIKKSQIPLLRRKCGIVFQDFKLLTDRNVYANLEFVLRATGWKNKKTIEERLEVVLEKVGMTDKKMKMPHQLSGGEQQRIVLARALLNAPPLILADEPTGNIDPETSYQLIQLLKEICETGKTIVIATHQYDLIEKFPGRVFCFENGELHEKLNSPEDACECLAEEVTTILEEVEAETDSAAETGTVPAGIITEEEITDETPVEEEPLPTEGPVSETTETAEAEKLQAEDPAQPVSGDAVIPTLGKLDFPEVTAFDYELGEKPIPGVSTEEEAPAIPATEKTTPKKTKKSTKIKEEKEEKNNSTPAFDLELD